MTELAGVLRKDSLYPHPERLVTFIGNHDTMRFFTAAHASTPKLKLAMGLMATLRGMPLLYSGDEIAMEGGDDPDNRHDFPGGFPGDARSVFTAKDREPNEQDVFRWTSGLLALRKAHPVLQAGLEQNLTTTDDVFVFVRAYSAAGCEPGHGMERVLVVVNKGPQSHTVELATDKSALAGCTEFEFMAPTLGSLPRLEGGRLLIDEPAESMTLYRVR
jgi:glycosidase